MAEINDFLNPKSMITPGITVTLTVSISTALANAFSLRFPWVAIFVSFMIAVLVVLPREKDHIKGKRPHLKRPVYCILNTLIIFSMSLGTGKSIDAAPKPPEPSPAILDILKKIDATKAGESGFNLFGIQAAYAQENGKGKGTTDKPGKKDSKSRKQSKKLSDAEQQQLQEYLKELKDYEEKKEKHDKKWSF